MDNTTREQIVQALISARRSGQRWRPESFEQALDNDDAYAIQAGVASALGLFPQGQRVWKVGGHPAPSAAALPGVLASPATWRAPFGGEVLLEAELAVKLDRTPASPDDVVACLCHIGVAIEIVDTRIEGGLQAPAAWKLADQSVNGGLVTGEWRNFGPYAGFGAHDWGQLGCSVLANGVPARQARGTHPNNDPLCALPWLYVHAAAHADGLRAGDIVTTGAWIALPVRPGDLIEVEFDGLSAASVQIEP